MDNSTQWKKRVNDLFQTCQEELQRATKIGKKMLSATKTNSTLHELYEELGILVVQSIENGKLRWDDPKALELVKNINSCKQDIQSIEEEVNKIKFASCPVDIASSKEKFDEKSS